MPVTLIVGCRENRPGVAAVAVKATVCLDSSAGPYDMDVAKLATV